MPGRRMLSSGCGECTDTLPRQQRREGPGEGGRIFVAWGHRLSVKLKVERGSVGATLAVARGQGGRIATTSVRAGLAMTGFLQGGTVERRNTWAPPYNSVFCRAGPACPAGDVGKPGRADVGIGPYEKGCRGGRPCPPGSARSLWCVGEGLSCPPSCQPTDGHCRTRQSGHFLETGSLHPPLAALRRFPLPQATARVAPTDGNKERGKRGVEDAAPYGGEQEVRRLSGGAELRP